MTLKSQKLLQKLGLALCFFDGKRKRNNNNNI